jgi:hypothetical protein
MSVVGSVLLGASASPVLACDLPKLPVIPATDQITDPTAVNATTSAYFDGMRAYADCIETTLTTAGGDAAPTSVKAMLVARSNAAVAEAGAIQKLYQERIGSGQVASPGSEDALRKLVDGLVAGMPDYDAMTPEYARTARQQYGFVQPSIARGGAIQSVEFVGIDAEGRNIFTVHQANGTTNARIELAADGKIDFAMLRAAPAPGERRPTATIPRRH